MVSRESKLSLKKGFLFVKSLTTCVTSINIDLYSLSYLGTGTTCVIEFDKNKQVYVANSTWMKLNK